MEEQGRAYQEFIKGLWKENPTFVSVLGMCPTLAVTNTAINGLAMGLATTIVLVASCWLVSVLRNWIPYDDLADAVKTINDPEHICKTRFIGRNSEADNGSFSIVTEKYTRNGTIRLIFLTAQFAVHEDHRLVFLTSRQHTVDSFLQRLFFITFDDR